MSEVRGFAKAGGSNQSQRFIIGRGDTEDELQITGEWIATTEPVEVRP